MNAESVGSAVAGIVVGAVIVGVVGALFTLVHVLFSVLWGPMRTSRANRASRASRDQ